MAQTPSSLKTLEDAARDLAAALKLPTPRGQSEREAQCRAAHRAMEAPDLAGVSLRSDQWQLRGEELRTLLNAGLAFSRIHAEFDQALTPQAWDQELAAVRQTLAAKGQQWWRWLSREYWHARREGAGLAGGRLQWIAGARIELVDAVLEAQRQRASIRQHQSLGAGLFGPHWRDEGSDWDSISRLAGWVQELYQEIGEGKVLAGIIDFLAENPPVAHFAPLVKAVEDASHAHDATAGFISAGLEAARRDLLDLGLRNPLLNYRLLRTRGLEVVDELPPEVHRILASEGRTMSFLPVSEEGPDNLLGQPVDEEAPDGPAARHTDTRLQTELSSQELQTRLLSTYHLANSFIQEQGANTLFLAFGMLTWHESDGSQEGRRAPLVLLPVALERSNVRERFHLRHTGQDPGENLSLIEKARTEFRVTIPGLPDADDLDIAAYFDSVEEAVGGLLRWSVDRESIVLGFFSFSKFLMYRDLDAGNWPDSANPTEHPIIGALLHEGFNEPAPTISGDDHLDRYLPPGAVHHVVDADGSQTLALVDVNGGRNLVVQGPPGTGKSQTITNMIAEAIGHGRTVLFVSEKMAALEVVKRRLDSVGLGDACLELHSHKTTKKAVLDELQRTLDLGRPRLGQIEADLDTLTGLRDRLNSYCEAVNNPVGDSGVSPYQTYGELALLLEHTEGTPLPKLDLPSMQSWAEPDVRRKEELIQELQARVSAIGIPLDHPFWGSRRRVLPPADQDRIGEALPTAQSSLAGLIDANTGLANALGLSSPAGRPESEGLCLAARRAMAAPDLVGVRIRSEEWRKQREEAGALVRAGSELAGLRERHGRVLAPDAWTQDLQAIRQTLDTKGRRWWRLLSGEYRQAKNRLAGLCRGSLPAGADAKFQLADAVTESQHLQTPVLQHEPLGRELFGPRWQGERSDWADLSTVTAWIGELYDDVDAGRVPEGIIDFLADNSPADGLEPYVTAVEQAGREHARNAGNLVETLDLDVTKRFGAGPGLDDQSFDIQKEALDVWRERPNDIHDIVSFNSISDRCRSEGLDAVLATAETWPQAGEHLLDAFRRAWFESVLERALGEREELAGFDGNSHQQTVERFRELDSLALQHNRARLAHAHWERLPRQEGGGQLGVLRREFQKRRRHLAIRQLIERAGNAVQAVKPVFMMSPLSIAMYISPGSLKFDLVIFDEASQVKPVDAFGAILRAGQAVVVGDSQQLPPSSFFDTMTQGNEDDDDSTTTADIESVLGLFSAQSAPDRMLRWHYRSRHESLIEVSNREFYNNGLVVFPSPDAERREMGLRYNLLPDTVYDRGRSRTNQREAEAVARAVMEHAQSHPELTLGVAAFSVAQMRAVLDQLELLRREDPSREGFFTSHPHEPFFVKNLETVQGDERDVMFISIGYGRDADGRVDMNFGPLNRDGGERRLNVLITRAKLRCEVFTNLTADDIDLRRTRARGIGTLKAFLAYAAAGAERDHRETSGEPTPPFQEAVAGALAGMGYELRHQVGTASHCIDLAVVDPDHPGRYLLGIVCDGPVYHSSRSARDRDRLRQQVLEGLGWRIHSIWSTDWFRNPERERQRMAQAIESAKTARAAKEGQPDPASPVPRDDAAPDAASKEGEGGEVPEYRLANPQVYSQGMEFFDASGADVALWVAEVVEMESPVHTDEVARRIANAAGVRRGRRFQETVDQAVEDAIGSGSVRREAEFLWWGDVGQPVLRDRSRLPASSRKIELVPPAEIALAVRQVVAAAYGIDLADIPGAAGRLLGFGKITGAMRSRIEPIIRRMLTDGELAQQEDQLVVADREDA